MSAPVLSPMHMEQTEDPDVLRWVIHDDRFRSRNPGVLQRPGTHGSSLQGEVLGATAGVVGVEIGHLHVAVRKAGGGDWRTIAPQVQSALRRALADNLPLTVDTPPPVDRTTDIAALIDQSIGSIVAAHGGGVEVVDVDDDQVTVRLQGACNGCPAARHTLQHALDVELRRHYPQLRSVRTVT